VLDAGDRIRPEIEGGVETQVEIEVEPQLDGASTAGVLRSSGMMAMGTAVSRILGFVRAAVLVAAVQPSSSGHPGLAGDAFSVANMIPNAMYILLAGGVLNAVLVPQITRAAKQLDGGQEYIDRLLTAAVSILLVVTVVATFAAPLLIRIYATGKWTPEQTHLAIAFALWCLPQIFGYGLYTMLGQVLNARGSFGPFTWAPVVNNVVAIAGLAVFIGVAGTGVQPIDTWTPGKIALLAGTSTLGVMAQALILIPAMRRAGIGFKVRWGLRGFGLRTASRVAGWTFAAILVQQLGLVVISQVTTTAGNLTSHITTGFSASKVVYDNAFLLFMLPHSLVAVSLVTALFTRMSISAADNRLDDVRSDLSLGLRLTGLATVLSAAAFLAIGPDITGSLFAGNTRANTDGIAYVAMAMMIGLVPFSAQYLFQRVFYAFEDAKTPFLIQVPIVLIWAVGNLISLRFLPAQFIVIGVGASMTVANATGALLAFYLLHRRFGRLDGRRVFGTHLKMVAAAAIGGVVAFVISRTVHAVLGTEWISMVIAAGLGGVTLIVIYALVLRRLKVTELDDALLPLLRRG
jgi:putative peptidoglycan lipid II flippase